MTPQDAQHLLEVLIREARRRELPSARDRTDRIRHERAQLAQTHPDLGGR